MYHRHPKRRFHLRKAVDPTPTPQARPVLPMKVSQLASSPGDPSKMPLPPPRKKKPGKSFFDSFRRGSPSSDNSPPLPKKEYSWSDRLGSIKKFMSNRPLPPLPKDEDNEEQKSSPPVPRKNDLSFIHKRVDEKPPQLPHRTQVKSSPRKHSEGDILSRTQESHLPDKQAEWASGFEVPMNNFHQTPLVPPTHHLNGQANRDSSEREISAGRFRSKSFQDDMSPTGLSPNFPELPNLSPTMPPDVRGYSTLKRPPTQGQDLHNQSFMSMPGDHFPGMHTSSSVTDLHSLDSPSPRGLQQFHNFPMPPHYPHPYPMYPHYPNYPQYFGTSFANLSTVLPNTDGDFSDHSDASGFISKKPKHSSSFGIKAKRSQSVMYDRMAYPPQYYPFGGFPPHPPLPGYGAAPWGQSDHQAEEPASPATSIRSFGRSHRSRHRKKKMVASDNDDEDDERLSVRSSPRSRTTSSSDRLRRRKTPKKVERSASPSSLTSSEEEENRVKEDRLSPETHTALSQGDGYQTKQDKKKASKQAKDAGKSEHKTKQHGSKIRATSHQKLKTDDKNFSPKVKKKEREALSSSESMDVNDEHVVEAPEKAEVIVQDQQDAEMKGESDYHSEEDDKKETVAEKPRIESTLSESQWQCEHCTFINSIEHRICQVCCKTKPGFIPQSDPVSLMVPEMQASSSAAASPILNTTSESLTSDTAKEYLTPPVPAEDDSHSGHSENEGQNFAKLNSDLEQAEKELTRGLMELMKLKEESDMASNAQAANRRQPEDIPAIDSQFLITQDTQTESKPTVPQIEPSFPHVNDKMEAPTEQLNQQLNTPKDENVASKSIGTDAMDFDFPKLQTHGPESITGPTPKTLNFGLLTQEQISPANSFTEITASAPSQKDITGKPALRRDSSCQTYQDESTTQIDSDIPTLHHGDSLEFQHPYNRADSMRSPQLPPIAPSGYRGFAGRGQGLMHRSHSRSSLFGDRYGDARNVPPEFDNLGFGFGPSPMYRSLSRSSLTGDYSDSWMSEVRSLRRPDFYLSMEELVERRRLESKRAQGLELVRMIREAEQQGFTADDIHVALNNCGKQNPVDWLQTNWKGMVDTVVTLATNYGKDKHENDIGVLSDNEARDALRMHKGNIWAAVTECVEGRQRKFLELRARGNFSTKEIVDALTQSEGNVELAYTRLSATTLKPFLMRIWGAGEGVENQDGAVPTEFLDPESAGWPKNSTLRAGNVLYGDTEHCSDPEDWDDDDDVEEEVSWNEDEEEEMENPENFDIEPQVVRRNKRGFASNNIATPESDSEYCDAFDPVGGDARSATSSSPVDEIFFVSPDNDVELQKDKKKGTSFLSRLAALRKNKKPQVEDITRKDASNIEHNLEVDSGDSWDASDKNEASEAKIRANDSTSSSSETNKIYSPLNILKQTFSAIKDSVIGSGNKNEAKHSRSITEARTIIVHDRGTAQETLLSEENTQKSNNLDISNDSSHRTKNKSEDIPKIRNKSDFKENNLVDELSKTLKCVPENKALLTTSETPDVQIPSVSNSSEKEPVKKKQSSRNSESYATTSANVTGLPNNTKNNSELVSLESKPKKQSFPVAEPQPFKRVEEETTKKEKTSTLDLSEQSQNTNGTPVILEEDRNGSISIAKGAVSKKSEEEKFPTQEKSVVSPEKTVDSSNNKDQSHPQASSHKPAVKSASNELGLETKAKNYIEMGTSPEQVIGDVINDVAVTNDAIDAAAKPPELTGGKSSNEKPKTKNLKQGLRLKIPDLGKTVNSEMQKDPTQPDKQTAEPVTKTGASPKGDTYLEEKQNTAKEGDKIPASTIESLPILSEQGNLSQDSHKDHGSRSDLFQDKPADDNISSTAMDKKGEEKSVTPTINISENEFHDMASKITEKLENCLEVLKSSEAAFTESEETTPPSSDRNIEVSASEKSVQSDAGSFQSNSETPKVKTESTTTDVSKISADREEKNDKAVSAKSPSLTFTGNEVVHVDDIKPTKKANTEVIASEDKDVSPDVVEEHGIQDSKTSELSSTISTVSDNKSVTHSASHETAQTAASITNAESPAPQVASSSASSDKLDETPVEFAGVKAKPFTGLNKKGKNQLNGRDKKQKDSSAHSPTPKATPDVTRSGKVSPDNKDSSDIKQIPMSKRSIQETENITQPHQGETEQSVHSITTKEEAVSPSNEELSQTTPDGHKNESQFPVQTELKETSSELVTIDTQFSNQAEQNTPESTPTANATAASAEVKTEAKSELANSESQAKTKEKKTALSATKNEPSVFSSSKFSTRKFKDQDMKSTIPAINKESSVPASSKVTGIKTKETKHDSTTISTNSSASISASTKVSDITAKEEEAKSINDASSTEASVSTPVKDSDIKTKEQDTKNATATAKTEASVSTPSKASDTKGKEQDNKNAMTLAKPEEPVSIPSKGSDISTKEMDTKAVTAAVSTAASVSTSNKGSDFKTEESHSKKDIAAVEEESSASVTKTDTDTEAKENKTESVTAAAAVVAAVTDEASASSSRNRTRLKMEIQGSTENSDVKQDSVPSSPVIFGDKRPNSRVEALKNSLNEEREGSQGRSQSPLRPQSPFGRMTSLSARKEAIANERNKEVRKTPIEKKPWFIEKVQAPKPTFPKRSIKQQLEFERKIRNLVSERKCRTYRKAEIVVQLLELNFAEAEALQAAHECSNLEQAISYLQQECLLCTGMYPVGQIVSMIHCPHKACKACIKAYFTIQIRDRTIMELLCPFCNEPDISDEDVAQDYFNHLDIMLKKLVEPEIHELFQRKLRDRVLMKDPNFRWCSQCSSGFISMPNLKRLICPDCNAITCAKCRRPWEREHEGISCEAFAAWKDANDPEAQSAGLAKLLQEDGIDCPNCHFRYTLAKGGCMHFRCIQCQHDFCSGCSRPFKMGQKCGVSEYCGKLGLHAHHPRNCLFYLRDKDPEDLQRLLDLNDVEYNQDPPEAMELKSVCQVMEQKETSDGLVDDICGKEVQEKQAGLCRVHYVEYLGQLVNKHKIDPIQIFCNDDLELVLRRASKRLPAKSYRDSEIVYREKLVQLIQEELPLELTEGS